jgi:hypothetical protein
MINKPVMRAATLVDWGDPQPLDALSVFGDPSGSGGSGGSGGPEHLTFQANV